MTWTSRLLWSVSVALLTACADTDTETEDAAQTTETPVPAEAAAQLVRDPQIAHVATTANTLDIDGGMLATEKAQNAEVKQFAQRMITEHGQSNREASQLAQSLGLSPADNEISQQLRSSHEQAKANLQARTGAEFDRAYIDHEVTAHQNVLNSLDQTLIPNAQNPQLKDLLTKSRAMVSSHLEQAKSIQGKLGT